MLSGRFFVDFFVLSLFLFCLPNGRCLRQSQIFKYILLLQILKKGEIIPEIILECTDRASDNIEIWALTRCAKHVLLLLARLPARMDLPVS